MTGTRSSKLPELRLVSSTSDAGDPRPLVLHALSGEAARAEVTSLVGALQRSGQVRQLVVQLGAPSTYGHDDALTPLDQCVTVELPTSAQRTATALNECERLLEEQRPEVVVIAGDGDDALAAGLVAAKLGVGVVRLGAGLRCWDWRHPAEINRVLLDRISDTLLAPSTEAVDNLLSEGIPNGRLHAIGSTRVDVVRRLEGHAQRTAAWDAHGLSRGGYVLLVIEHYDGGTDAAVLRALADAIVTLAGSGPVVATLHPRTVAAFEALALTAAMAAAGVVVHEPSDYLQLLSLLAGAGAVVTDAGWVQQDTSALGVACFSVMATTPLPVTLTHGTNVLLGDDPAEIAAVRRVRWRPTPAAIPLWDGRAGQRAAQVLLANYTLAGASGGPDFAPLIRHATEEHA